MVVAAVRGLPAGSISAGRSRAASRFSWPQPAWRCCSARSSVTSQAPWSVAIGGCGRNGRSGRHRDDRGGISAGGGRGRRRRGLAARQLLSSKHHRDGGLLDRRRGRRAAVRPAARPDLGGVVSAHRPRTAAGRIDQHCGDLRRSRHPCPADHRDRAGPGVGPRFRSRRARHGRHLVDPDRARPVQHRGHRAGSGLHMASRQDRDRQPAADDGGGRSGRNRRGAPPARGCARCFRSCATCCSLSSRSPPC